MKFWTKIKISKTKGLKKINWKYKDQTELFCIYIEVATYFPYLFQFGSPSFNHDHLVKTKLIDHKFGHKKA
jgi:hypothetical protein